MPDPTLLAEAAANATNGWDVLILLIIVAGSCFFIWCVTRD